MATNSSSSTPVVSARQVVLLLVTFAALLLSIGLFFGSGQQSTRRQQWDSELSNLQGDVSALARIAINISYFQGSAVGEPRHANILSSLINQIDEKLIKLKSGVPEKGIPSLPPSTSTNSTNLANAWHKALPSVKKLLNQVQGSGAGNNNASLAARNVAEISLNAIEPSISAIRATLKKTEENNRWFEYGGYGTGAIALIALILFIITFTTDQIRARRQTESKDAQQQQAILTLLDEITDLASGDLTVNLTVAEDFTGAIADSINYTIETLRTLVGTINRTSEEVAAAASRTTKVAHSMSVDSDRQAQKITAIADEITGSSRQLQEVSARAEQLSAQAQQSFEVAHGGTTTVSRTIQNMASLRDQIQETSKRIKRLGESSQEIGNIIEFIDDIAEQTNTLSLNAAIQAAMAGEAGRGFAVVAEQVQALAERASAATRQVENLIKTIQADSQEAISSMERSTSNVVAGATSAEEAGQSLARVEAASSELSQAIIEISQITRTHSENATNIAEDMAAIRQIAAQTSDLADQTAQSVGELSSLSEHLRESIRDFTLPDSTGEAQIQEGH